MSVYTDIVDGRIAANKPGTTGLMTDFRNNDRFFKEMFDTVGIVGVQSINDDFAAAAIDADAWDSTTGGTGVITITTVGHYVDVDSGNTDYATLSGTTKRMRVRLTDQQAIAFEFRMRGVNWNGDLAVGLQDSTLGATSIGSDTTDFIGILRGTNSNTFKARVQKAGAGTSTDNIGDSTAWNKFRFTVVKGASSLVVDAYLNDSQIANFPVSANVPDSVTLFPVMACKQNAGRSAFRFDYFTAFWTARPLSA